MTGAPSARLFYALWPTAAVRGQFAEMAAHLACGEPVPTQNLHLTIAFVGEVPWERVAELRRIGAGLRVPRCELQFDALEYWPKPEVVVVAAREIPESLANVWQELHARLAASQFALTPKRLRPHVTLARKVSQAPVLQPITPVAWQADQCCLVRSQGGSTHAIYTVVDTWSLLDTSEK